MSYYGFYDDDYKEGQKDFERYGRPSAFDRDRHFGGERLDVEERNGCVSVRPCESCLDTAFEEGRKSVNGKE